MNTLKKETLVASDYENGRILIEDYRFYQQSMIEYFLEIIVNYISVMNPKYLVFERIEVEEMVSYSGLSNNEIMKYTIFVKVLGKSKEFFRIFIPKLVYDNFYYLNGNYYVPLIYIIDKPIIIKENSINLASLFSSITINFKSGVCIFTGRNIDLNIFISTFLFDDTSDEAKDIKKSINFIDDETEIVNYFNNILKKNFKNIKDIINFSEKLFFDEYTEYLYSSCYSDSDHINVNNLSDIIKIALTKFYSGEVFDFIDLKNKRLSFIELLLAPLFKKAANITYQVSTGFCIDELMIDQYVIVKNFHKNEGKKTKNNKLTFRSFHGLSGKTLYDLVNLYSSLLVHKCSFVKPGMKSPPRSIANIHESHFGKLCPITVSAINPGEMLSIVPEIFVDPYGQFLDLD
ncbi:hypothetical protein HN385_07250 [archaeon]|jgi:hypothetical protein|nr:hypothetical protein [archaeon]